MKSDSEISQLTAARPLLGPQISHWTNQLFESLGKLQCKVFSQRTEFNRGMEIFESWLLDARKNDSALWWIGNGGSSAIASHLSQDFLNKLQFRSQTFNDSALITCFANDFGYENVFQRALHVQLRAGDILIAVSSKGNSEGIIRAVDYATKLGCRVVCFSGFEETNRVWSRDDALNFYLPAKSYGLVEVGHLAILHALLDQLEGVAAAQVTDKSFV